MEHFIGDILKAASETDNGIIYVNSVDNEVFCSYRVLLKKAYNILAGLQAHGLQKGAHIIFQIADNVNFIGCFWGCVLGGFIPVPLPVCIDSEKKRKLINIITMLDSHCIVSDHLTSKAVASILHEANVSEKIKHINMPRLSEYVDEGKECILQNSDIAMIQFSSGSTGMPKGVQLTHKNIITNIHSIVETVGFNKYDTVLSWLPLTHDMGLIGAHMTGVLLGVNQYIMPTQLFLRFPGVWFDKMSEHRVTVTLAPNFAYRYIITLLRSGITFEWNLDKIRFILNGAEPISADVCNAFVNEMAQYGLRNDSILNVYGMAEASLAVAFSLPHEKLEYTFFEREALSIGDKVRTTSVGKKSVPIVNVGKAISCCEIRIADENNNVLAEGIVGEIQLAGEHITMGYYRGGELNEKLFTQDGWLHTGDVGFFYDGKLFISGRFKEILFVNGQNFYPHDMMLGSKGTLIVP